MVAEMKGKTRTNVCACECRIQVQRIGIILREQRILGLDTQSGNCQYKGDYDSNSFVHIVLFIAGKDTKLLNALTPCFVTFFSAIFLTPFRLENCKFSF